MTSIIPRALLIFSVLLLSCMSVDIELEPNADKSTSFNHYSHYGFLGLIGHDSLNIKKACMEGEPQRAVSYFTFEDILFAISTVGLYSPKSLKIQCEWPSNELQL